VAIYIGSLLSFYVIARVRAPLAPLVMVIAGAGIALGWDRIRGTRRDQIITAGALAGSILLAQGMNVLVDILPRPTLIRGDTLPAEVVPVQATFGGEVQLLGYGYYDSSFRPGGYLTFELYWRALVPPSKDYTLAVRYIDRASGDWLFSADTVLGSDSVPALTSSQWEPGSIFYERYLLYLPPLPPAGIESYDLVVGLYDPDTFDPLPITDSSAEALGDFLRLTGTYVTEAAGIAPSPESLDAIWEEAVGLEAGACRLEGETLKVDLTWTTLTRAPGPAQRFVHVIRDGELLAQDDGPPFPAPPDALPPGVSNDTHLEFEGISGPATLRIGLYDFTTGRRWALSGSRLPALDGTMVAIDCEG
jgi:hypothetical protein